MGLRGKVSHLLRDGGGLGGLPLRDTPPDLSDRSEIALQLHLALVTDSDDTSREEASGAIWLHKLSPATEDILADNMDPRVTKIRVLLSESAGQVLHQAGGLLLVG